MTTLESTLSMVKTLQESELLQVQNLIKKLQQNRQTYSPTYSPSKKQLLHDLQISRQQVKNGQYEPASRVISELKHKYGI